MLTYSLTKQKKVGMHLYEYSVIRFVPKVEREEFFNVGLILFCKQANYIQFQFKVDVVKFNLFDTDVSYSELVMHLEAFERIARGRSNGGRIATLDIPERFRWLTAVKSACLQASRPHSGRTSNLEVVFQQLYKDLVL